MWIPVSVCTALVWLALGPTATQDAAPASQPDMQALLEMANPGPEHERLAAHAGEWEVAVHYGGAVYRGRSTHRMLAAGRFLACEYEAAAGEQTTVGQFTLGFDRRHGRFTIQAIDSWGTYFVTAQGVEDEASGQLKLYGTDDDPQLAAMGIEKEFGYAIDLGDPGDPDRLVISVFMIDNRTEARHELEMLKYVFERTP